MIHQLEADSILLTLNSREILSSVYIKCETGKVTGLLGRNGNGKSCLLNVIYGTLNATTKSIRLNGTYLSNPYQKPDVLTYLSQTKFIPRQLSLKRVFADYGINYSGFENTFPEFKLKYNTQIKNLSGGEKRLVEIYLVLKSKSSFALLDEPFSMLSPLSVEIVKELISEVKSIKGILVTDHLFNSIIDISDDIYVLSDGNTRLIKNLEEIEFLGYARIQNMSK